MLTTTCLFLAYTANRPSMICISSQWTNITGLISQQNHIICIQHVWDVHTRGSGDNPWYLLSNVVIIINGKGRKQGGPGATLCPWCSSLRKRVCVWCVVMCACVCVPSSVYSISFNATSQWDPVTTLPMDSTPKLYPHKHLPMLLASIFVCLCLCMYIVCLFFVCMCMHLVCICLVYMCLVQCNGRTWHAWCSNK